MVHFFLIDLTHVHIRIIVMVTGKNLPLTLFFVC